MNPPLMTPSLWRGFHALLFAVPLHLLAGGLFTAAFPTAPAGVVLVASILTFALLLRVNWRLSAEPAWLAEVGHHGR